MLEQTIINEIFNFFTESEDFNGILLSKLAKKVNIDYKEILPLIESLIKNDSVSIQYGVNPHIIRLGHFDEEMQLKVLEEAKKNEVKVLFSFESFDSEIPMSPITSDTHPICIYPSKLYLKNNVITTKYDTSPFSKRLGYGDPQIFPLFFDIDVIDRYFNNPRYRFKFDDYSGSISIVETRTNPSSLRENDQIFLKTFGLGYNDSNERVIVAYLRYLSDLSSEHQVYWNSKLVDTPCTMVKEYYQNTILGDWTESRSTFSAFIEEQRLINEMSFLITGKYLFRETFEDNKRPKEFTFFNSPTLMNYEGFINLLDKMISENINKGFFKDEIEGFETITIPGGMIERRLKGTLTLLNEWLKSKDPTGFEQLMGPFKEVRSERQSPAHKINENYYDKEFFKKQMDILKKVHKSLVHLRHIFQLNPLTSSVKIPEWIEKNIIKDF